MAFICGSDEHGVPITIKARMEGCTPQDIVDRYHKIIKDSFTGLGINFDIYGRTSSAVHERNASEFFRNIIKKDVKDVEVQKTETGYVLTDKADRDACYILTRTQLDDAFWNSCTRNTRGSSSSPPTCPAGRSCGRSSCSTAGRSLNDMSSRAMSS